MQEVLIEKVCIGMGGRVKSVLSIDHQAEGITKTNRGASEIKIDAGYNQENNKNDKVLAHQSKVIYLTDQK